MNGMRFSNCGSSVDVVPWYAHVSLRNEPKGNSASARGESRACYHVWRPAPIKLPRTRSSACTCTPSAAHAHRNVWLSRRISSLLAVGKINRVEVNANEAFAEPARPRLPHPARGALEGKRRDLFIKCARAELESSRVKKYTRNVTFYLYSRKEKKKKIDRKK